MNVVISIEQIQQLQSCQWLDAYVHLHSSIWRSSNRQAKLDICVRRKKMYPMRKEIIIFLYSTILLLSKCARTAGWLVGWLPGRRFVYIKKNGLHKM